MFLRNHFQESFLQQSVVLIKAFSGALWGLCCTSLFAVLLCHQQGVVNGGIQAADIGLAATG